MIQSIVITETRESNQPWFALIVKYDTPTAMVALVKYENYVFQMDATALSRGSVWIRSFERFYSKNDNATNEGFVRIIGELSQMASNAKPFKTQREKIIYPAELANMMQRFPLEDASYFAKIAIKRAKAQINGDEQAITEREKNLMREIQALKESRNIRKKKKKSAKLTY